MHFTREGPYILIHASVRTLLSLLLPSVSSTQHTSTLHASMHTQVPNHTNRHLPREVRDDYSAKQLPVETDTTGAIWECDAQQMLVGTNALTCTKHQ